MIEWILENKVWFLSGLGTAVVSLIITAFKRNNDDNKITTRDGDVSTIKAVSATKGGIINIHVNSSKKEEVVAKSIFPSLVEAVIATQESLKVIINYPKNGERKPHCVAMHGEVYNLLPSYELWIVKEPHQGNYHPDSGPININGNKWIGNAFIGHKSINSDTNQSFKIHIVAGTNKMGRYFQEYIHKAHSTEQWTGLPEILGGNIVATVTVIRDDSTENIIA